MKSRITAVSQVAVIAAALFLLSLGAGCARYRPAHLESGSPTEMFSFKAAGSELGRGTVNIAFCWFEIPHEIKARVSKPNSGHPFCAVSNTFKIAFGALNGTIWAVERATGGAVEVALSLFPPYDPLMKPAYPPYLNHPNCLQAETPENVDTEEQNSDNASFQFERIIKKCQIINARSGSEKEM
jgi:putative exosortase-associated protein (TIGR04073 family)